MKTDKSSNTQDTNRKVYHPVNHESMKEKEKLQGRDSGDGREGSYKIKDEIDTEKSDDQVSSMKTDENISSVKSNEEDVKKEFEIRSGKSEEEVGSEESEEGLSKKRDRDPIGQFEKDEVGKEDGSKESQWRRSYKGDAEIVP